MRILPKTVTLHGENLAVVSGNVEGVEYSPLDTDLVRHNYTPANPLVARAIEPRPFSLRTIGLFKPFGDTRDALMKVDRLKRPDPCAPIAEVRFIKECLDRPLLEIAQGDLAEVVIDGQTVWTPDKKNDLDRVAGKVSVRMKGDDFLGEMEDEQKLRAIIQALGITVETRDVLLGLLGITKRRLIR